MSKKPGFQVVLYYVTPPTAEQLQGIWNFVLGKYVNDDRSAEDIARSVEAFAAAIQESQGIFIPGGFSGGDEPEGSAKFITAFFRHWAVLA